MSAGRRTGKAYTKKVRFATCLHITTPSLQQEEEISTANIFLEPRLRIAVGGIFRLACIGRASSCENTLLCTAPALPQHVLAPSRCAP